MMDGGWIVDAGCRVIKTRTVAALGLLALSIGALGVGPGVLGVLHCGLVRATRLGAAGQAAAGVGLGEVRGNGRLDGDGGSHRRRGCGIQGCMGSGRAPGQLACTCRLVFCRRAAGMRRGRRRWVETGER